MNGTQRFVKNVLCTDKLKFRRTNMQEAFKRILSKLEGIEVHCLEVIVVIATSAY